MISYNHIDIWLYHIIIINYGKEISFGSMLNLNQFLYNRVYFFDNFVDRIKDWMYICQFYVKNDCEPNSGNALWSLSISVLTVVKSRPLLGLKSFLLHYHLQTSTYSFNVKTVARSGHSTYRFGIIMIDECLLNRFEELFGIRYC